MNKQHDRLLGTFVLPGGQSVVGELSIAGEKTLLSLHSENSLENLRTHLRQSAHIEGMSYAGERITLIDCLTASTSSTSSTGSTRYRAEVFPHYVTVGHQHLKPGESTLQVFTLVPPI